MRPPYDARFQQGFHLDVLGLSFLAQQDDLLTGLATGFGTVGVEDDARLTSSATWWDNPTMILTLDAKRRLTVPASLAPTQPGDHFKAEFDPEEDAIVFRRIAKQVDWLAVLKACPVKMDALPPRSRQFPKHPKL